MPQCKPLPAPLIAGLWYLPMAGALAAVSTTQSFPAHEPLTTALGACSHSAPPSGMRSSLQAQRRDLIHALLQGTPLHHACFRETDQPTWPRRIAPKRLSLACDARRAANPL